MDTHNNHLLRPVEVLLVEDNPGDVRLIKEVFKEGKVLINMAVAKDGEEAIEKLKQGSAQAGGAQLPDIVLLDLNLPKKNGRDVLAEIKLDAGLRRIPVVILTGSKAEEDIVKTYELQGNCYITKPVDLDQFIRVIRDIENFWLTIVRLPGFRSGGKG